MKCLCGAIARRHSLCLNCYLSGISKIMETWLCIKSDSYKDYIYNTIVKKELKFIMLHANAKHQFSNAFNNLLEIINEYTGDKLCKKKQ